MDNQLTISVSQEFEKLFSNFSSLSSDEQLKTLMLAQKLKMSEADIPLRSKYYLAAVMGSVNSSSKTCLPRPFLCKKVVDYIKEQLLDDYKINVFKLFLNNFPDTAFKFGNLLENDEIFYISSLHTDLAKKCLSRTVEIFKNQQSLYYAFGDKNLIASAEAYSKQGLEIKYIINAIKEFPIVLRKFLSVHPEGKKYANMI